MSATTLQFAIAAAFIVLFAAALYHGLRVRQATKRHYEVVFFPRETLAPKALAAAFAPSAPALSPDDILAILEGAAKYLAVAPGKLRPTDDFSKELAATSISPTLTARAMGTMAYKKLRSKYPGLKDSAAEMRTLGDFVAAIARDIERARKTT